MNNLKSTATALEHDELCEKALAVIDALEKGELTDELWDTYESLYYDLEDGLSREQENLHAKFEVLVSQANHS